jgi:hypothetical protein
VARRAMHPRVCALTHCAPLLRRLRCKSSFRPACCGNEAAPGEVRTHRARKAQPQEGPAQRVAEAEPMEPPHSWQQTGLADHKGRTKDEEGTAGHVILDTGEPKAIASTERMSLGDHAIGRRAASPA